MPPKAAAPPTTTNQFLVPRRTKPRADGGDDTMAIVPVRGAKHAGSHSSTEKALVLRKAAYGTGEIVLGGKISGQEKLELLAGELMKTALRPPVNLEELSKKIDAMYADYLDTIANLKDHQTFIDDIMQNINARNAPDEKGKRSVPITDPRYMAQAAGSRIHNVYMMAGAWHIVRDLTKQLQDLQLNEKDIRGDLRKHEKLRERYLALYDMVIETAKLAQENVAKMAAGTPHYAPYFAFSESPESKANLQFNATNKNLRKIREAHRSFIDAIVLELALPNSDYPPWILLSLLHDATEECKKELGRFNQALWDAVGDFSTIVEILDTLEGPLLGPEGQEWIRNTQISPEFTEFLRTAKLSDRASQDTEQWKDCFNTIASTKNQDTFGRLWKYIDLSYKKVSKVGIDDLWELQEDLKRPPQWSATFLQYGGEDDADADRGALVLHKKSKRNRKEGGEKSRKQLLENSDDDDDDDEIPELMTVSDTSDEYDPVSDMYSDSEYESGDGESDFDEFEDEELQEQLREAVDMYDPFLEPTPEMKKSKNPFMRMFAHFRDRVFSSDPNLMSNEKSRNPFKPRPAATAPAPPTPVKKPEEKKPPAKTKEAKAKEAKATPAATNDLDSEEELPPLVPLGATFDAPRKSQNVTIEEVEDEDEGQDQSKKKKKKKKKKSNKKTEVSTNGTTATTTPASPAKATPPASSAKTTPSASPAKTPTKASPLKPPQPRSSLDTMASTNFSQASLPLPAETKAQSARSYLQSENLNSEKTKVKSRPAFSTMFKSSDKEKDGKKDDEKDGKEKKGLLSRVKKIHLGKKASELMSRLVGAAEGKSNGKKPMKWEQFLTVMRAMGFTYEPSTAGSSVRFDPPNPKDPPVTFHKPHPDPTLQRNHLRNFGKKLVRRYGWKEEMFTAFGVAEGENSYDEDSDY